MNWSYLKEQNCSFQSTILLKQTSDCTGERCVICLNCQLKVHSIYVLYWSQKSVESTKSVALSCFSVFNYWNNMCNKFIPANYLQLIPPNYYWDNQPLLRNPKSELNKWEKRSDLSWKSGGVNLHIYFDSFNIRTKVIAL